MYESLVQGSGSLALIETTMVPALLQTRPYAAAIEPFFNTPLTTEQVDERVDARMARQEVLDRTPNRFTSWRKSTFSDANANCVEVSTSPSTVLVRDSKHPDNGHVMYTTAQVAALIDAAAEGRLDHLA